MDESYLEWLSSIPGSDAERARRIAERFPTYESLRGAPREELLAIEGLSPSFVDSLLGLLGNPSDRDAAEHLFLCPECGSFAGSGATKCAFCGVEFESSKESELAGQLSDFLEEEDTSRICQTCGATMGGESTTCPVCGRQYDAEGLALLPSLQPTSRGRHQTGTGLVPPGQRSRPARSPGRGGPVPREGRGTEPGPGRSIPAPRPEHPADEKGCVGHRPAMETARPDRRTEGRRHASHRSPGTLRLLAPCGPEPRRGLEDEGGNPGAPRAPRGSSCSRRGSGPPGARRPVRPGGG